jgi:hypothetical protein
MAEARWTRAPVTTPPTVFTLVLSEDEARAILAILNGSGDVGELRSNNPAQYEVGDALQDALAAADRA